MAAGPPFPPSGPIREPDGGYYEELEHTADLALRCGGPGLGALFRSAALGMYRLMGAVPRPGAGQERRVGLESPDIESLLVDWLGELLYLAEVKGWACTAVTFDTLAATRLQARLTGGNLDHLDTAIKAVTYHGLKVESSPEGYTATVVFDV